MSVNNKNKCIQVARTRRTINKRIIQELIKLHMLFFIDINCSCLYVSDISKSKSIPSRRHNNCEVTAPHPLRWSSRKIQTRGAGLLISVSFLLFIQYIKIYSFNRPIILNEVMTVQWRCKLITFTHKSCRSSWYSRFKSSCTTTNEGIESI